MNPSDCFPKMPAEVDVWLDERASYLGWPPVGREWFGVMRGRSVEEWAALNWQRRTLHIEREHLTHDTLLTMNGLFDVVFNDIENEYSVIGCSKGKIGDIARYVQEKHAIPGTLIFLEDRGLLDVVDGCHRLMFYLALREREAPDGFLDSELDAWIGFHGLSGCPGG